MECYAQTISVSLSLKLKPVNAKGDSFCCFFSSRAICGLYTVPVGRGGGGGGGEEGHSREVWLELYR